MALSLPFSSHRSVLTQAVAEAWACWAGPEVTLVSPAEFPSITGAYGQGVGNALGRSPGFPAVGGGENQLKGRWSLGHDCHPCTVPLPHIRSHKLYPHVESHLLTSPYPVTQTFTHHPLSQACTHTRTHMHFHLLIQQRLPVIRCQFSAGRRSGWGGAGASWKTSWKRRHCSWAWMAGGWGREICTVSLGVNIEEPRKMRWVGSSNHTGECPARSPLHPVGPGSHAGLSRGDMTAMGEARRITGAWQGEAGVTTR